MYGQFLQHFLRNPKKVGAILPLSKRVAQDLLKELTARQDDKPWHILEVGAGLGNITEEILKLMKKDDRLDVIEIDKECCKLLKERFKKDVRPNIYCLSILDWIPPYQYDFIVSTLPLNIFSSEMVERIFGHYQKISNKKTLCTYVEYIGLEKLSMLFSNQNNRELIKKRRYFFENFHRTHLIKKNKIFMSFLPCYVYHLTLHHPVTT